MSIHPDPDPSDASKRSAADRRARIEVVIAGIPVGRVSSYGQVADHAGCPGMARLVVRVLRESTRGLPWHRVVRSDGRIGIPAGDPAYQEQIQRLRSEGVEVTGGRVPLGRHGVNPLLDGLLQSVFGLGPESDPPARLRTATPGGSRRRR